MNQKSCSNLSIKIVLLQSDFPLLLVIIYGDYVINFLKN